jgi:hypothetical protein
MGPISSATVTVDASELNDGDYAGLCALQGCYGAIAITKTNGQYFLVMLARPADYQVTMGTVLDNQSGVEYARLKLDNPVVTVKVVTDFTDLKDEATFYYLVSDEWLQLSNNHQLHFKLDHFTGCRFGLFYYSTKTTGGNADFLDFKYKEH